MRSMNRREALEFLIAGALAVFSKGYVELGFAAEDGNFRHIYLNRELHERFFLFLRNVFHLYPEHDFDALISKKVALHASDREIYEAILGELPSIKPALREIRYALPALRKQKAIMCEQTLALLDGRRKFSGYVEIGSPGRYLDRLGKNVRIAGTPILMDSTEPRYRPQDIMERGGLRKVGRYVSMNGYEPISATDVPDESVDLVTIYIGFHHSPKEKKEQYIRSIHRILRRNGVLIVRDHDVNSGEMIHFVALAHDVFNAGLELPWQTNADETRNFLSLAELEKLLVGIGFQKDDRRLLQPGDPTMNTLLKFVKV